jgi:hypothetical protein
LTRAPRRGRAGAFASDASEHYSNPPPGLFPRGATGTVTNMSGVGEIEGEVAVWVRMDQHFRWKFGVSAT